MAAPAEGLRPAALPKIPRGELSRGSGFNDARYANARGVRELDAEAEILRRSMHARARGEEGVIYDLLFVIYASSKCHAHGISPFLLDECGIATVRVNNVLFLSLRGG